MCTLWGIWKIRNEAVFQNVKPSPFQVIIQASLLIQELQNLSPAYTAPQQPKQIHSKHCRCPIPRNIKINSDAAFDLVRKKGVAGIIGRDDFGSVVLGHTCLFPATLALLAEVVAL